LPPFSFGEHLSTTPALKWLASLRKRVPVTVNGVFAPPHERRVLWQLWYLLSH